MTSDLRSLAIWFLSMNRASLCAKSVQAPASLDPVTFEMQAASMSVCCWVE
jgi:hypothetical protein